jgi:hypothetical protein
MWDMIFSALFGALIGAAGTILVLAWRLGKRWDDA